jgi:hypothetical protein
MATFITTTEDPKLDEDKNNLKKSSDAIGKKKKKSKSTRKNTSQLKKPSTDKKKKKSSSSSKSSKTQNGKTNESSKKKKLKGKTTHDKKKDDKPEQTTRPSLVATNKHTSFANRILTNLGMFRSFRGTSTRDVTPESQESAESKKLLQTIEESEGISMEQKWSNQENGGQKPDLVSPKQTIAKLKTFTKMLGVLNTNKDFLKAFEEDGDDDSDSRQMKRGSRTSANNLLTELQQYEESLAKERAAVEHERGEIAVERESLNTMLDSEMAKNQDLQYQILEMRKEVDQQAVMLAEKSDDTNKEVLLAELDVLKKKLERQGATISALHVEKGKQNNLLHEGESGSDSLGSMSSSSKSSAAPTEDAEENTDTGSHKMLANAKMNGEILKLQGSLKEKEALVNQKNKQILDLKKDIEDLGQNGGIQKMKDYIQALEQEKTYFASELENVKRASINTPMSPASRGFFGWGWGNNYNNDTPSTQTSHFNPSEADLIEIGSFASPKSPKKLLQSTPSARLNSLTDGL